MIEFDETTIVPCVMLGTGDESEFLPVTKLLALDRDLALAPTLKRIQHLLKEKISANVKIKGHLISDVYEALSAEYKQSRAELTLEAELFLSLVAGVHDLVNRAPDEGKRAEILIQLKNALIR